MKTWQQFLLEKTEHEFSSTQVDLPKSLSQKIAKWGKDFIDEDDIDPTEGRQNQNDIHVTILYGLHTDNPDDVRNTLKGAKPFEIILGKTSVFECEKYDVVKLDIESKDLHKLNKKLSSCEHTNNYPEYKPHCTIAYVKKGCGKKYVGNTEFKGTKVKINNVVFSDKSRNKTPISIS